MPKFIDLTGLRFGGLVVLSRTPERGRGAFWEVRCDCGSTKVIRADALNQKRVRSCGCAIPESNRTRVTHGHAAGGNSSKLYKAWGAIKRRCFNPNAPHYHRYGGRGITMHPEWVDDFAKFAADVGEPHDDGLSLDRIDNGKGYEPGNVRWATRKEQSNNRENNVRYTHNGATHTLTEWARVVGISYAAIRGRWLAGKRGDELLAPAVWVRGRTVEHDGVTKTLTQWAKDTGIPYVTLRSRLMRGDPLF